MKERKTIPKILYKIQHKITKTDQPIEKEKKGKQAERGKRQVKNTGKTTRTKISMKISMKHRPGLNAKARLVLL